MIQMPLAFAIALISFAIGLIIAVASRMPTRARAFLAAFFVELAVMGILIGLRDGYQISGVLLVLPVLAMLLPPTLYLGFNSLTQEYNAPALELLIRHGWAPVLVAIIMSFPTLDIVPIDVFVFSSLGIYLFLLAGLSRAPPDKFVHLTAPGYRLAVIGLVGAVALLSFVLTMDTAIFVSRRLFDGAYSDAMVQMSTILIPIVILAVAFAAALNLLRRSEIQNADELSRLKLPAGARAAPSPLEHRTMEALETLLVDRELFRDSNLTLARIARRMGQPAREISMAVNRCKHENFSRYINGHRIRCAMNLLKETNTPVTEIMFESGFLSKSNFNSEFSRVAGMTPSIYRSSLKSEATVT
jgi:AraC-like DNA-binding protein